MARGWESKSVEDQMAEREAARSAQGKEETLDPRPTDARAMVLSLSRARILQDLQSTCDRRRRAQLEAALADVDIELRLLS